MKKISNISGQVIPLAMNDVDTDLIIPAQYLTSVSRSGFGQHLFSRLRAADPNFIFNQPKFSDATILVAQHNFGCGSSREHAVWALQEKVSAIIAISFADIFYSNSAKNGLVLIQLPEHVIYQIIKAANTGNCFFDIDIAKQKIVSNHNEEFNFTLEPFRQYCCLNGLDDLDYLLTHQQYIERYDATQRGYHA